MSQKLDKIKKETEIKKLEDYKQSKPVQLELFSELYKDQEGYSNTVELYDVMPKYKHGGVSRESGKYLDNLHRDFQCRDKDYSLTITPASLTMKDGSTKHFYPSQREELVEDVIRKFLIKQSIYLDEQHVAVKTTYYAIQQELKRLGHGYNTNEIKQSIEVCGRAIIEITSKDGNEVSISSPIFPFIGRENKSDIKSGRNKLVIMLHPLVTKSINEGTYRAINYEKVMTYNVALSRWLHKKISHYYTQLGREKPYPIKLSTIVRDFGMVQYEKISHTITQIKKALNEMVNNDTLQSYGVEKIPEEGKKILDAKFLLYPSDLFISDVIMANSINNRQLEVSKSGDKGLTLAVSTEELRNLRKEMEEPFYGLSKTIINNYLSKIKTKEDYESTIELLSYIKSYAEKKLLVDPNFNIAGTAIKAIREKWIPPKNFNKGEKTTENLDNKKNSKEKEVHIAPTSEQLKTWNKIQKELKKGFGEEIFDRWLSKLNLLSISETEVTMNVESKFLRDWITREYLKQGGSDGKGMKGIFLQEIPELKNITIIYFNPAESE